MKSVVFEIVFVCFVFAATLFVTHNHKHSTKEEADKCWVEKESKK